MTESDVLKINIAEIEKECLYSSNGNWTRTDDTPIPLTPYEQSQIDGPPQKGFEGKVITIKTDLLGEKDMTFKQFIKDVETAGSAILSVAPAILSVLLPKSKATPIVTAIAPLVGPAMAAANTFVGIDGAGTDKAAAASALLQSAVSLGKVVSTGGQAHTMDEFQAALPEIQKLFTGIINALDGAASIVTQAPAN